MSSLALRSFVGFLAWAGVMLLGSVGAHAQNATAAPASNPVSALKVPISPGQNFSLRLSGNVSLDMIWIKAGSFTMGDPDSKKDAGSNNPTHPVTLTKGFWLDKYLVTEELYAAVTGKRPGLTTGAKYPAAEISWDEAVAFCKMLTAQERAAGHLPKGYVYSLPTEAQWEYAARAGKPDFSANEADKVGWHGGNSGGTAHPVGLKEPNAWGLYDMHGNAWEWCLDFYGPYPTAKATDPTGPTDGEKHILRGGNWSDTVAAMSSARRWSQPSDSPSATIGFRVALVPETGK